jgi:hypothetical protein
MGIDVTPLKLTRRVALRRAILLAATTALSGAKVLHGQTGQLTINLDQWSHLVFERKGQRVVVPIEEVFDALQQGSR